MKMKIEKSDAKKTNPWVVFGIVVAIIAITDVDRRKKESRRQPQQENRRNALVSEEDFRVTPLVNIDIDPSDVEFAATRDGAGKSLGERHVVVIADKDGQITRSTRAGKNQVVTRSGKTAKESDDHEHLTEEHSEALARSIEASVISSKAAKMEELERKLAEAGEKIREAAERAGAKVSERSRNVIVSRVLGEKAVPPIPPVPAVPPAPPLSPGSKRNEAKKTPEPQKFLVRSGPCATREKSLAEARTNLEKIVSSRLNQYGLQDSEFVGKAVESLRPKFEVEESFREVGGDRYPLYVASVNVDLGPNFERQALRLVNQQTAHQRFSGLMGLSFGVVALLVGIDRMFLGQSRKIAEPDKSLV